MRLRHEKDVNYVVLGTRINMLLLFSLPKSDLTCRDHLVERGNEGRLWRLIPVPRIQPDALAAQCVMNMHTRLILDPN